MKKPIRKPEWVAKKGAPEKRAFAVGRRTSKSTALMVMGRKRAPLRGPFTLEAVVSAN